MQSDEPKRSVMYYECQKNESAKLCWEEDYNFKRDWKKVVDRERRLFPRNYIEKIHYLKHPNHINKISNILSEIWLPILH